jgi:membrane protein YqaA with SNARE-associated domain
VLLLGLFGTAFVGTLFWVASPEVAVAVCAVKGGWHPLAIGAVAGTAQAVALALLFAFGDQLRIRWGWFNRKCARFAAAYGKTIAHSAMVVAVTSGLLGLPPVSATAILAPGVGLRARQLLAVMFVMRVIRFAAVAALANQAHVAVAAYPGG